MAAGAAHELNNPLSVIVGYLSLILAGRTPAEQLHEQLQMVATEARHCRTVLAGLTELAEAAQGDTEVLDLRALLVDAEASLRAPPQVVISIAGDAHALVRGNQRGLSSLVTHALRNCLEASARSLRMTLSRVGGVTRLELRDDGRGMSAQVLARARDPFYSTKPDRLGLGLALGDAVAWAHGGSLSLASAEGRGTTLTLALPSDAEHGGVSQ